MNKYLPLCAFAILLSAYSIALAQKPPFNAMRSIARSMGSVSADFKACGSDFYSGRIRVGFETAIIGCDYGKDKEAKLLEAFDAAAEQRSADVGDVGGSCFGNNDERFRIVRNQIRRIETECDRVDDD